MLRFYSASPRRTPSFKLRGLTFNEEKTRVVHLAEGFDFLGTHIRKYADGAVLITPSKNAVRRARQRIKQIIQRTNGQASHEDLILTLNSFAKVWSMYYSPYSSSRAYRNLDFCAFGQKLLQVCRLREGECGWSGVCRVSRKCFSCVEEFANLSR
ncbi:group II intron maturase-specific domain-containing protein [Streptomyces aureocirculatus]|uniref:group II intron maturase-specific domain-containing protein n=1 Tax=Streptomyces aureocirculatus TaxID=67275 RepID=UPI00099BB850|nr:group II intron maturase-specific domain-containing protein [Streptomyces aureocirculatus]